MLKNIVKKSSTKHRDKLTWINFFEYSLVAYRKLYNL